MRPNDDWRTISGMNGRTYSPTSIALVWTRPPIWWNASCAFSSWCGRTGVATGRRKGARAQAILTSILGSAKQQGKNPIDLLVEMLCSPKSDWVLNLVPPVQEVRDDSSPAPPLHAAI